MIRNKQDLKEYMYHDRVALKIQEGRRFPRPVIDNIWKYEILLRKTEYYTNVSGGLLQKVLLNIYKFRLAKLGQKLGFSIGINVFGPGLSIAHYGCIVVNSSASVGANCRIHEGVTIGATNGEKKAASIGNNVFIGSGAKIIGDIKIVDDVAIGAGAVVVKDVLEKNISVAGVPAIKISNKGSGENIIRSYVCDERKT